jgi:hypothetical protein
MKKWPAGSAESRYWDRRILVLNVPSSMGTSRLRLGWAFAASAHDPEKACPGLDPTAESSFQTTSCASKMLSKALIQPELIRLSGGR